MWIASAFSEFVAFVFNLLMQQDFSFDEARLRFFMLSSRSYSFMFGLEIYDQFCIHF
jgi:hypothetical protein